MDQYWQHLCMRVCANALDLLNDVQQDWHDSLCLCIPHVAQGICPNRADVDWAKHVVELTAKVAVQKANPMCQGPLSSVSTKNTLCDSTSVHAQYYQPHAHEQIGLVSFLNKIRQT